MAIRRRRPRRASRGDSLAKLVETSRAFLEALMAGHEGWGIRKADRWDLDLSEGNLVFSFADGLVATCPAQIIGTYSLGDSSWLWSWANPSIPAEMTQDAQSVRAYGRQHSHKKLIKDNWPATEEDAWNMTAVACKLCNAQGAYRGPGPGAHLFMTFASVQISKGPLSG